MFRFFSIGFLLLNALLLAAPLNAASLPRTLIDTLNVEHYRFPQLSVPQQPAVAERINEFLRTEVLVPIVAIEAQHYDSPALLQHIFSEAELVANPSMVEYSGIDYQVTYNAHGIVALMITVASMGAYPSVTQHYLNFALDNGALLMPSDLFENDQLKTELTHLITARVTAYAQQVAPDMDMPANEIAQQVLAAVDFSSWPDLSIQRQGIAFYVNYQLPHAIRGLAPDEKYEFSYADLKQYFAANGALGFMLIQ